uniref:TPM domain-containing protein n=1 Tax=Pseudactinotalea sp. TaxID=1926260 RepID=UPI003B3AD90A
MRRNRKNAAGTQAQRPGSAPGPKDPWAGVSTAELSTRAGSALVALDNDVRSSANELAFAEAQFGIEATREFKATLEQAQQQLGQAFAIQQQLGDSTPEPEPAQRQGLIEILQLCQAADEALDSQTTALGELRALQDRAPALLDELDQRARELEARVPAARDTLRQLGATYPATALATVAKAPDQAQALLDSAEQSVAEGRSRVQADDRGTAVAFARTAEDALHQVGALLEMVAQAGQTLADASGQLDGAIASLTSDVSDAGRLAPSDPTIAPAVQRAQAALQAGATAKTGGDPIAALNELAAAEQSLDAALAPRREQEQVQARAGSQLVAQITSAESAVRQANTFIETNRGVVASTARTRLATANEALARARSLQQSDVQAALTAARAAQDAASGAMQLAQNDVNGWRRTQERSAGGGYYGRSGGIDGGSLILGGILNEVMRGGSRSSGGRSYGGGWGGSGSRSGGGFGGGSRSGGSRMGRSMGSVSRSSGSRRSGGSSRHSGGGRRR